MIGFVSYNCFINDLTNLKNMFNEITIVVNFNVLLYAWSSIMLMQ